MIHKGRCDKGFIWNPNACECECDKSYHLGQYLDYESWKCRKQLIDKLIEECSEDINGNKMIYNVTLSDYGKLCNSCTVYIVLLVIFLIICISISCPSFYFH